MDELWKSVLAELQLEVSKPTFSMFFTRTKLVSLENSVATVSAPTYMMAEQIEKRYTALIKSILDKKTNLTTSVLFTSGHTTTPASKTGNEGPLFSSPAPLPTAPRPTTSLRVKADYQFETLAVSDSNQLAYTASFTVAKDPGKQYNPLFLYGSVGVGKTHLMHAIANRVSTDNPSAKILYLTTEEFTNEVVEAIMNKNTQNLRKKFRHTDLLLLDDIQFLTGKDKVQEELFHTFNALIDRGGQIVFSSDRPPSELKKIEARLASRFEGGLTVDIQSPDFELRSAILLIKSKKYNLALTSEMAQLIAGKVQDARALEGFLLSLSSSLISKKKHDLNIEDVLALLGKKPEKSTVMHPDTIVEAVCSFYNIKTTQLKGVKRDAFLVRPRHVCMFLLKEQTKLSLKEIGNLLGGRDHTTIMHGIGKIEKNLQTEERVKEEVLYLREHLVEN